MKTLKLSLAATAAGALLMLAVPAQANSLGNFANSLTVKSVAAPQVINVHKRKRHHRAKRRHRYGYGYAPRYYHDAPRYGEYRHYTPGRQYLQGRFYRGGRYQYCPQCLTY